MNIIFFLSVYFWLCWAFVAAGRVLFILLYRLLTAVASGVAYRLSSYSYYNLTSLSLQLSPTSPCWRRSFCEAGRQSEQCGGRKRFPEG